MKDRQTAPTPAEGWAAQELRLPVAWYQSVEAGSGAEFPVSGDETAFRSAGTAASCNPANGVHSTPRIGCILR